MRKVIFKKEIKCLFLEHSISETDQENILSILVEKGLPEQYLIKEEVLANSQSLDTLISDQETEFIKELKALLSVQGDINLPRKLKLVPNLAFFVGSGASKLLGMPLWGDLSNAAIEYLYTNNKISFVEKQELINESSPKHKLSVFSHVADPLLEKNFYNYHFKYDIKNYEDKKRWEEELNKKKNIYKLLVETDFPKFTINIDDLFRSAFEKHLKSKDTIYSKNSDEQFYSPKSDKSLLKSHFMYEGFTEETNIQNDKIYYLHGHVSNINSCVMTNSDYLEKYYLKTNENVSRFKSFLDNIFKKYTILFIGVGMEEFELLAPMLEQGGEHHLLLPTYLNNANLFTVKRKYFVEKLKLQVHPYYLDFEGYDRLYTVLENWMEELRLPPETLDFDKKYSGIKK